MSVHADELREEKFQSHLRRMSLEEIKSLDSYQTEKMVPNPTVGQINIDFMRETKELAAEMQKNDKSRLYDTFFSFRVGYIYSVDISDGVVLDRCKELSGRGINAENFESQRSIAGHSGSGGRNKYSEPPSWLKSSFAYRNTG